MIPHPPSKNPVEVLIDVSGAEMGENLDGIQHDFYRNRVRGEFERWTVDQL